MGKISAKQLIAVNLKYSSSAKPLKTLAFAQLLLKAMYKANKPISLSGHASNIARLIGVSKISIELVKDAMEDLREEGKVDYKQNKWFLTPEGAKITSESLDTFQKQLASLVLRHFPKSINKEVLITWFMEAATNFFGYFGDEWVRAVCNKLKGQYLKHQTIEDLLIKSLKKHNLISHRQELIDGFHSFLNSDHPDDHSLLMSIGHSMFSSQLVAADIGADFLTIQEIINSKFILDTNFLIAVSIESPKVAKSLNSLGSALKRIKAKPVYLNASEEEYKRVLAGKKNQILNLVETYEVEVIFDAMDNFIQAAKKLHCRTKEDFERFFLSIRKIPKQIPNGPSINKEDDPEIEKKVIAAREDSELKSAILKFQKGMRPYWERPKSELALNHDSALLHVAEFIRSDEGNCWILSLDKTLHACDISKTGPHTMPLVITVDVLIQILALDNAGPELDASDFAPLLQSILLQRCTPPSDTYTFVDLLWLHNMNERVADFPTDEIKSFARFIAKNRLEGKNPKSRKFQLDVQRRYQEKKIELSKQLIEEKDRRKKAETKVEKENILRKERENQLISLQAAQIIEKARKKLIGTIVLKFIALIPVAIVIIILLRLLPFNKIFGDVATLIGAIFTFIIWAKTPYDDFKKVKKNASVIAKKQI